MLQRVQQGLNLPSSGLGFHMVAGFVGKTAGSFALSSLLHSCRAVLPSTSGICILTSRYPSFYAKVLLPLVENPSHICGRDTQ